MNKPPYSMNPLGGLLVVFGLFLVLAVAGSAVAYLILNVVWGLPFSELSHFQSNPQHYAFGWAGLMLVQGCSALVGFVGASIIYWRLLEQQSLRYFFPLAFRPSVLFWVKVVFMMLCAIPLVGYLAHLNEQMHLPEAFKGIQQWMREQEDSLADLTKFLTHFSNFGSFLIGLLVVAVLAAVGEELLFRGVVLNIFERMFKNIHVAVWVTAFVFSAFHLQFYGFLPRLLLGAVLGYSYIYSRSLWVPILGHFINNGLGLLGAYLYQQKLSEINVEESQTIPLPVAALSGILVILLMSSLKQKE